MSKPKNQNRTFHLLQKADILTCYEHPSAKAALKEGFTAYLQREAQNSADGRRYLQTRW